MIEVKLGKIQKVIFGKGGYDDAMLGITFVLGGDGWGVQDFWGYWSGKRSEHTKWTEEDRISYLGKVMLRIGDLLAEAKKSSLSTLENVPVEITFDNNALKSWRVLTEVI